MQTSELRLSYRYSCELSQVFPLELPAALTALVVDTCRVGAACRRCGCCDKTCTADRVGL